MKYNFYYQKDCNGFEHYYKLNGDGIGIHVNVTSPCINKFVLTEGFGKLPGHEVPDRMFDFALNEALSKLGLTLGVKPFKIV